MSGDEGATPQPSPAKRVRGQVTRWGNLGFGYARAEGLPADAWLHPSNARVRGSVPRVGQEVEFTPFVRPDGRVEARDIVLIGPGQAPAATGVAAVDALLQALDDLDTKIDDEVDELALATAERQRLVILSWIAAARVQQDLAPKDRVVNARVYALAQRLNGLCKDWWPGNVSSLQRGTTPVNSLRDLPPASRPHVESLDWATVSQLAQTALAEIEAEGSDRGRDEYGWADAAALEPQPWDADAELQAVRAEAERFNGPTRPGPAPDAEDFWRLGCHIRWLRGAVLDQRAWGQLMGWLRFHAAHDRRLSDAAGQLLAGSYVPECPWARLLGRDVVREAQRGAVERFLAAGPPAADEPSRAAWLHEALLLAEGDGFEPVLAALAAQREWIVDPAPAVTQALDTRPLRRRLRRIQESLAAGGKPATPIPAAREPTGTGAQQSRGPDRLPSGDLARARRLTEGRRAMFTSNREDPMLADALRKTFRFAELRWIEAKQRRLDAAAESIRQGAVDMVLLATGFAAHTSEALLVRACRSSGTPYVRVNKGRPLAVLSALLRDLPPG